jgi:hypothetical protein
MIPKDCKRLAEVDFPIAVVSKHAARDLPAAPPGVAAQAGKSIRQQEKRVG